MEKRLKRGRSSLFLVVLKVYPHNAGRMKFVEGKVLMRNREVLTLDEEKILFEAKLYRKEMG